MTATARRIIVDIDSTLYPMVPLIAKYLERLHGIRMAPSEFTRFAFFELAGITAEQGFRIIEHCHADAEILAQRPYPGAVETIQAWAARGAQIHVVSDRMPSTFTATHAWLKGVGIPAAAVVLAPRIDKLAYAQEQGGRAHRRRQAFAHRGLLAGGDADRDAAVPPQRRAV